MKSFLVLMMIAYCNGEVSSDVQKAFVESEIIPDTLKAAPTKILSVRID